LTETLCLEKLVSPVDATPRWVKVFAAIALAIVVLILVLVLVGRGEHGPGRHLRGDETPPAHTGPPPGVTHE
jgi:hypothetical protein